MRAKAGECDAPVPALDRGLAILELVAERGVLGFTEIMQTLEIPRSSTAHLIDVLVARACLRKHEQGRGYAIGPALGRMAGRAANHFSVLASTGRNLVAELANATGNTVQLCAVRLDPDGVRAIVVAKEEPADSIKTVEVGRPIPFLHRHAAGKPILAHLSRAEFARVLARDGLPSKRPQTLTTLEALETDLAAGRRQGWFDEKDECRAGLRRAGVAILGADETVAGSLAIALPDSGADPQSYVNSLKEAAARAERWLGRTSP